MSELPPLLRAHEARHILGRKAVMLGKVPDHFPHLVLPDDIRYPRDYTTALKMYSEKHEGSKVSAYFMAAYASTDMAAVLMDQAQDTLDAQLSKSNFDEWIMKLQVKSLLNVDDRVLNNWAERDLVETSHDRPGMIGYASLINIIEWRRPEYMTAYQPPSA